MGYKVIFKDSAIRDLDHLDQPVIKRLLIKIEWSANQENPLAFATKLTHPIIGQYRFRIGDYRVIFDHKQTTLIILRIDHRRSIYES